MNIVLVGNPNVGKSSLFSRLCDTKTITCNFPGTTIRILKGTISIPEDDAAPHSFVLLDAPGIYTLDGNVSSEPENAAKAALNNCDIILNIIDAAHLERNLYLTTQLLPLKKPMIIVLNMWDEAQYAGISINTTKLAEIFSATVVPTIGLTGFGARHLINSIKKLAQELKIIACNQHASMNVPSDVEHQTSTNFIQPTWEYLRALTESVQVKQPRNKQWREHLATLMVSPVSGVVIAIIILIMTFALVACLGSFAENLIEQLFNFCLTPILLPLHTFLSPYPFFSQLLIGAVHNQTINYSEAMGLFTSAIFIPLAKVAPVVTIFYIILGILEDCGYLPRLAVLSDTLMHRFSLHGFAALPMILGAGCSVTGIIATRILNSRRQRIIVAILLSMTIPCTSQTAVMISLMQKIGSGGLVLLFSILIGLWYSIGRILGVREKESYRELLLELPPFRMVRLNHVFSKLSFRLRSFFADAIPITIVGIFLVFIGNYFHMFDLIGNSMSGFLGWLWGLPPSVIPILLMGLFRKEIALSFLQSFNDLTAPQIFTTALLLAIYFPCISVYTILYREFGIKTLINMTLGMILLSSILGAASNLIAQVLSIH